VRAQQRARLQRHAHAFTQAMSAAAKFAQTDAPDAAGDRHDALVGHHHAAAATVQRQHADLPLGQPRTRLDRLPYSRSMATQ
jgi:hypothetical protein